MKTRFSSIVWIIAALLIVCSPQLGFSNVRTKDITRVFAAPLALSSVGFFHFVPDYDSGWISIDQGEVKTFEHNLGGEPDNYVVDLQFKDTDGGYGVNQVHYGGEEYIYFFPEGGLVRKGTYWRNLTDEYVLVKRKADDYRADQVRVRIWVTPAPSFDSDWTPIAADDAHNNLDHNVSGDTDDYIVDMQFKEDQSLFSYGVNQIGYGLIMSYRSTINPELEARGALWRNLTDTSILVRRGTEDKFADELRVRIWENKNPDYDSGWINLDKQSTETLSHHLGGNADEYVVDLQFKDEEAKGINQQYYGGNFYRSPPDGTPESSKGAYWLNLTNLQISIWRELKDTSASKARLRIWVTRQYDNHIYLPVTVRND